MIAIANAVRPPKAKLQRKRTLRLVPEGCNNIKKYILHHIFPRDTHLNKTSLTFTVSGFPSLSVYPTSSMAHLG